MSRLISHRGLPSLIANIDSTPAYKAEVFRY